MCTAISYKCNEHYFGRNLDLEYSYGESVIVTPRSFRLDLRRSSTITRHYAMIGTGIVVDGFPLYYEATNEKGLSMAGLNFPGYAVFDKGEGEDEIAVFEFIPWVLSLCENVPQARKLIGNMRLTTERFSDEYPVSPLHFIISDRESSITVESTEAGLRVYDNPVGVLTNNPEFPYHMTHLCDFTAVSAGTRENTLTSYPLTPYSRGMGGMGLPGDMSSASRFVRAVFLRENTTAGDSEEERVCAFFHMLNNLAQLGGCVRLDCGKCQYTVYSCCANTDRGIYYYTTYNDPRIRAVSMTEENKTGSALTVIPMTDRCEFIKLN